MPVSANDAPEIIRSKALELLLKKATEDERATVQAFLAQLDADLHDRDDAEKLVAAVLAKHPVAPPPPPKPTLGERLLDFLQSSPFYFLAGCVLLGLAFVAEHYALNSSLIFLVAMLGVAVLLYGTGSQAAGSFGGDTEALKALQAYIDKPVAKRSDADFTELKSSISKASGSGVGNIVIAGGAAVLTAVFGYGVIAKAPEIRQVFRDWDRYSIVKLDLCNVTDQVCFDRAPSGQSAGDAPGGGESQVAGIAASGGDVDELSRKIMLVSQIGRAAFSRVTGHEVEFVIFDQDFGMSGGLSIIADSVKSQDGSLTFSVDDSQFKLPALKDVGDSLGNSGRGKLCLTPENKGNCSVALAAIDATQGGGITTYTIRVKIDVKGGQPVNDGVRVEPVTDLPPPT